jgi:hypothetical protein
MIGDGERDVITQTAATLCTHVPTFETTDAIQRSRNKGCRSGAHGESDTGEALSGADWASPGAIVAAASDDSAPRASPRAPSMAEVVARARGSLADRSSAARERPNLRERLTVSQRHFIHLSSAAAAGRTTPAVE